MGIGLKTPRGSGTSGYVHLNLAAVGDKFKYDEFKMLQRKRKKKDSEISENKRLLRDKIRQGAADDLQKHRMAREIELKCLEYRIELEKNDETKELIERKVNELRVTLKKARDDGHLKKTVYEIKEDSDGNNNELISKTNIISATDSICRSGETLDSSLVFDYKPLHKERNLRK